MPTTPDFVSYILTTTENIFPRHNYPNLGFQRLIDQHIVRLQSVNTKTWRICQFGVMLPL